MRACCRFVPCTQSGSFGQLDGCHPRASLLKPMTWSASCRNRVSMRWLSASAVCFIGPQRPSCTIEKERSTHSATAALIRRSVSVTSKSPTSKATPVGVSPDRRNALDTVRAASIGSSSRKPRPSQAGGLIGCASLVVVVVATA